MRVATRPMNPQAVAAANAATDARFPNRPRPGDPEYGAFRKTWMDSYVEAGGAVETTTPEEAVRAAEADAAEDTAADGASRDVIEQCADTSGQPPPPPAADTSGCSCQIASLGVVCEHGRSARDGLLMVVADNAFGDEVTVTPATSGACEGKITVRASGKREFPVKDTAAHSFKTSGRGTLYRGLFDLHRIPPVSTTVSAEACGRQAKAVKVHAYPSSKLTGKLDLQKLVEDYKGIAAHLPIRASGEKKPIKPLDAPKGENWKAQTTGAISVDAQWKEDMDSHRAFCGHTVTGGMDPVFGVAASYPIFGIPVPPRVDRYIKAGLYLNIGLGASISAGCEWAYWPDTRETEWHAVRIELKGSGSLEIAAELIALSEDVAQAKIAGKATISVQGTGQKGSGNAPELKGQATLEPLTATVIGKMAWGLIETERSWTVTEAMNFPEKEFVWKLDKEMN